MKHAIVFVYAAIALRVLWTVFWVVLFAVRKDGYNGREDLRAPVGQYDFLWAVVPEIWLFLLALTVPALVWSVVTFPFKFWGRR